MAGFTQGMPMHAEVKIYLDGDGKLANTTPTIEPLYKFLSLPEPPDCLTVVPETPYLTLYSDAYTHSDIHPYIFCIPSAGNC